MKKLWGTTCPTPHGAAAPRPSAGAPWHLMTLARAWRCHAITPSCPSTSRFTDEWQHLSPHDYVTVPTDNRRHGTRCQANLQRPSLGYAATVIRPHPGSWSPTQNRIPAGFLAKATARELPNLKSQFVISRLSLRMATLQCPRHPMKGDPLMADRGSRARGKQRPYVWHHGRAYRKIWSRTATAARPDVDNNFAGRHTMLSRRRSLQVSTGDGNHSTRRGAR